MREGKRPARYIAPRLLNKVRCWAMMMRQIGRGEDGKELGIRLNVMNCEGIMIVHREMALTLIAVMYLVSASLFFPPSGSAQEPDAYTELLKQIGKAQAIIGPNREQRPLKLRDL